MQEIDSSREPLRPIVDTQRAFDSALCALADGTGDVAFDTERAHGHRYWPKAYLLQIRREGAGTWLIDPVAFEGTGTDLSELVIATGDARWIIHAASQDLPCMQEIGILPPRIFDTEVAARLLGKPGASLGALLKEELGIGLRKAHSADNWSRRPLPESWLTYAALDVDYLVDLADVLWSDLDRSGRVEWSLQEDAETLVRYSAPPVPRPEPWRRLSGVTHLRTASQLAIARELWTTRDAIAQRRDRPPTWILPDAAIIEAASLVRVGVPSRQQIHGLRAFSSPPGQRNLNAWLAALERVEAMPEAAYPSRRPPRTGIPHPRTWDSANPEAAARWTAIKPVIDELACDLGGLQPSMIAPPHPLQEAVYHHATIDRAVLLDLGVRPWQADFLVPAISVALGQTPAED